MFQIILKHVVKSMRNTLYFIGAGRVTRIILEGLSRSNRLSDRIIVTDTSVQTLDNLCGMYPTIETKEVIDATIAEADFVFISLHPPAVSEVIKQIAPFMSHKNILVSLAPKINGETLQNLTMNQCPVIRLILNVPSYVNVGYNPVWYADNCSFTIKEKFVKLMNPLGNMPEVPERNIEAYAVITSMGPTYLWFQIAELIRLSETFGLSPEEAKDAVLSMTLGAVSTMRDSNLSASNVMDLIPVKPMVDNEEKIRDKYVESLTGLYKKLTS